MYNIQTIYGRYLYLYEKPLTHPIYTVMNLRPQPNLPPTGTPFLREEHKVFPMFSQSPLNGSRTLDWIYNSAYSLPYPSDGAIL